MNCIICGKQAPTKCDSLDLCLSHHLEKAEDTHLFVIKHGLQALMVNNGYGFDGFLRIWVKEENKEMQ